MAAEHTARDKLNEARRFCDEAEMLLTDVDPAEDMCLWHLSIARYHLDWAWDFAEELDPSYKVDGEWTPKLRVLKP